MIQPRNKQGASMKKDFINSVLENIWIDDNLSNQDIKDNFKIIDAYMEEVYQFVLLYYDYMYLKKDYGDFMKKTMLEDHLLSDICDYPGITTTELANKWHRTTSSISQTISKFVDAGYVLRKTNENNRKIYNLYITEIGEKYVLKHKLYDIKDTVKTMKTLLKTVSTDDLNSFFKVLREYNKQLKK